MLKPQYCIAQPRRIDAIDLDEIASLVERGEAVEHQGLMKRVRSCELIGFAKANGHIITCGAIKNPEARYLVKIARNSGSEVPGDMRELGYVVTEGQHRGKGFAREICRRLVAAYPEPLFATTSDAAMERMLQGISFIRVGVPWASDRRVGEQLTLWLRSSH
jgi:hypothetical protein